MNEQEEVLGEGDFDMSYSGGGRVSGRDKSNDRGCGYGYPGYGGPDW